MLLIGVRGNDKSVPPLCPAHSQLIADTVRLLRGDLARIEGLSYLIAQHIIFFLLFPARHSGIAGLCQKELVRHGGRITFISGDILSAFCFLRVLAIVQTIPDSLSNVSPSPAWRCNKVVVAKIIPPFHEKGAAHSDRPDFGPVWPEAA